MTSEAKVLANRKTASKTDAPVDAALCGSIPGQKEKKNSLSSEVGVPEDQKDAVKADVQVSMQLNETDSRQNPEDSGRSKLRILANRKNALKSTGPKDTSLTRFNALKHGLTANKIVVTPMEDPAEYDALVEALVQDFQPQTTTEALLIQQVASCHWRRQRFIKAEKVRVESKVFDALFKFNRKENAEKDRLQSELTETCFNPNRPKEIAEEVKYLKDTYQRRGELHISKQVAPDLDALMIRYDSTLERQFYRALVVLLKIQSARQGRAET